MMSTMGKIQELQKCADRHRVIHDSRQKVEYRVLITVLTFYAGATWAIVEHGPARLSFEFILAFSVGYPLLAILTSILLYRLHYSNQVNMAISENYETEIIQLLQLNGNPIPKKHQKANYDEIGPVRFPVSNWGWQTIILFCFAFTGLALIWAK